MDINKIKNLLKSNSSSQSQIARELRCTPGAVHNTIKNGLSGNGIYSQRIAEAIAKKISKTPAEIFPNRYLNDNRNLSAQA